MNVEEEIVPEQESGKSENAPYLTGTVDLWLLPSLQVALWLQEDRSGSKPALKGSLRRETREGYWQRVGDIALWRNE
jgi:hypothetical protein